MSGRVLEGSDVTERRAAVDLDLFVEVRPGQFKRLGDCDRDELGRALRLIEARRLKATAHQRAVASEDANMPDVPSQTKAPEAALVARLRVLDAMADRMAAVRAAAAVIYPGQDFERLWRTLSREQRRRLIEHADDRRPD